MTRFVLAAAAVTSAIAGNAAATWSIVVVNTRTGEVGVASATCLTNFDLRNNTPVLLSGIGAATAQSFVDATGRNRVLIRDRLIGGVSPQAILDELGSGFDSGHQTRQYGIVDVSGRAVTFSGTGAGVWKGGQTGQAGELAYAVQGNVLTGAPVVAMAVDALINTPGDMPAKLMAAMEAARAMGGDGRCSCSDAQPDSCGAPPATFTKSAHIAYLMIARLGDLDTSTGIYRLPGASQALAVLPRAGDAPALVAASANPSSFTRLFPTANRNFCNLVLPTFEPQTHSIDVPGGAQRLAVGDLNGDGIPDIVALGTQAAGVMTVYPGAVGDVVGSPVAFDAGAAPSSITVGDLDGDGKPEVVIARTATGQIDVYANTTATAGGTVSFAVPVSFAATASGLGVRIANLDGNALPDIVTTRIGGGVAALINSSGLNFAAGPTFAGTGVTNGLDVADFNLDGLDDVVLANSSTSAARVIRSTGTGFVLLQDVTGFVIPLVVKAGLIDGDNRPDLFMAGSGRIQTAINTGTGFGSVRSYATSDGTVQMNATSVVLGDFDRDGDTDAAMTTDSGSVSIVQNLGRAGQVTPPTAILGRFTDRIGAAAGDYFLNLNIANQTATAVDPVIQLRTQFTAWRNQTEAAPDAVNSLASFSPRCVSSLGGESSLLTIDLKNAAGNVANSPVRIEVACADADVSIGTVNTLGGGRYSAIVTIATSAVPRPRKVQFRVITNQSARPVLLMPMPVLRIGHAADINNDGVVDFFDYLDFVQALAAQSPAADFNGDGIVDFFDYLDFVAVFAGGGC